MDGVKKDFTGEIHRTWWLIMCGGGKEGSVKDDFGFPTEAPVKVLPFTWDGEQRRRRKCGASETPGRGCRAGRYVDMELRSSYLEDKVWDGQHNNGKLNHKCRPKLPWGCLQNENVKTASHTTLSSSPHSKLPCIYMIYTQIIPSGTLCFGMYTVYIVFGVGTYN